MPPTVLRSAAPLAVVVVAAMAITTPKARAQSYPIDCAILLCLSGGWPASLPCTRARAEFIRRITPWPVEPPLQIWRCPMGASFEADPHDGDRWRLWEAFLEDAGSPRQFLPGVADAALLPPMQLAILAHHRGGLAAPLPDGFTLQLAQDYINEDSRADIDISGREFDFVRSIRVYDIDWREYDHENWEGDHDCRKPRQRVRLGSYGTQGDFGWRDVHVTAATSQVWMGFVTRRDESCAHAGYFRGVAVEWRDYEGNHGFEVVRY